MITRRTFLEYAALVAGGNLLAKAGCNTKQTTATPVADVIEERTRNTPVV